MAHGSRDQMLAPVAAYEIQGRVHDSGSTSVFGALCMRADGHVLFNRPSDCVYAMPAAAELLYKVNSPSHEGLSSMIRETKMHFTKSVLLVLAFLVVGLSNPVFAGDKDPLFIGLSNDSANRASHVLHFAGLQLKRGHPVTLWLNESGVFLASQKHADKHAEHQETLTQLMNDGAGVIVCRYCMKQLGVDKADLLPGMQVGNPDLVGGALFREDTRTLTW